MDLDPYGPAAPLSAAAQGFVPDQVMMGLRSGGPIDDYSGYLAAQNWPVSVGEVTPQRAKNIFSRPLAGGEYLSIVRMDLPFGSNVAAAAQELSAKPFVAWAAPNFVYDGQLEFTPNDPLASKQYHHALMENLSAWDTTLGSGSVILAVTDTGVDWNHVDLSPNIWANPGEIAGNGLDDDANGYIDDVRGWDFSDNDADPKEEGGTSHGTHVAGIAAARTNNATGVAGTAGGVTLMPLRISASPTSDTYAAAYAYAADNGARIVSTSFNVDGRVGDPTYEAALQYLYESGVLHLNSAGNDNTSEPRRQAFHQSLFVANTTSSDTKEGTSNYGTGIDISAPGTVIRSTLPGNSYGLFTGTSMSAPNAAGVAALIWSAHPTWSRDQVAAQLIGTTDPIDQLNPAYAGLLGSGRVNSFRAVTETLAPPRFDDVSELGAAINPTIAPPSKLTINLASVFDEAAVENVGSWDLRSDGPNGVFGDADDVVVGLTVTTDYMIGTNSVELAFALLPDDHYQFTAGRGLLVDPFGTFLDGNLDGAGGDDFVREFTVDSSVPVTIGPDAFGYLATAVAPEFEDIAATGTVILANVDDGTAKLSDAAIADFQFQFYGVTHSELYVSSNGLITFVSANSSFGNTDLTTSPSQASIAVLWDDLTTVNGADAVYWQVLGSGGDERLIVQWNAIDYFGGTDPITFQAVLYEADGSIQLNFQDLAGGDTQDEGSSATVGIKASGTQGTTGNRLLISRDDGPNAFVGTGLSTRIALSIVVPDVSIGDVTSVEDNGGVTTAFDFLVTLSEPTTATVTVEVSTVDGSATESDGDFTALVAQVITFLPGEVSKTVTVDVAGDDRYEGDEAFSVVLGNPVGGVIAGGQGVGTIIDDDKPTLSLAVNLYEDASGVPGPAIAGDLVTVGQTFFVEVVAADWRLAPAGLVALSIDAAWDNPSLDEIDSPFDPADAASPLVTADLPLARSGVLDNATATVLGLSGESSPGTGQGAAIGVGAEQRFSLMRFRADAATNGYLPLSLALGAAGVVFADAALDFDLVIEVQSIRVIPTLAVSGGSVTEGDSGTKSLQFTVSLATPSPEVVTVQVDTADDTATEADGDYLGVSGLVLTFNPGETTQTVAVDVFGDTTVEPSETLDVNLSAATNAAIATASATLTITNDDVSDPLDVGLVTYWSFDEGAGATAADSAPFGQVDPGSLGGDTAWSPDGVGGSVVFDGSGDYIDVPDSPDLNRGIHATHSVALWFNASDALPTSHKQVLYEQGGGSRGLNIYLFGGALYVGGWNTIAAESNWRGTFLSIPISSDEWHHVALVLDGTSTLLPGALTGYLDGALIGSGDGSQVWDHGDDVGIARIDGQTRFHTGASSGTATGFAGFIDEVRVYDRALSDAEVSLLADEMSTGRVLTLSAAASSVFEDGETLSVSVERTGSTLLDLVVDLSVSDSSAFTAPGQITIPAGQASASFFVQGVDDSILDGTQTATLTATATGFSDGTFTIDVLDDDVSNNLLVAWWTFDEQAGSIAADTGPAGIDNSGSLLGDTAWNAQGLSGSVSFDGTGDYVDIPDSADINLGIHAQETVAFWFKAADATISSRKQVLYEQGGSSRGLSIYLYNGLLYIGGWNTTATQSNWQGTFLSAPVTSGAWHHVALVLNGTSSLQPGALAGYLDGSTFAAGHGSQIWDHGDDIGIGRMDGTTRFHSGAATGNGDGFAGLIDDVRVYSRVLADSEISLLARDLAIPVLSLNLEAAAAAENLQTVTATVTRGGSLAQDLVVSIASSDTSAATAPATVTILAGNTSASFDVTTVDDLAADGTQQATFTATQSGYIEGSVILDVLDDDGVSPANLVAYWNLDEGAGSIAADTSADGLDNSGALKFDAAWSAEGIGGSLQFDGNGDYVDIPDSRDINVGIHARTTVALWFKVTDASISSRKQVLYEQGGISRGLSMYVYAGSLYIGGWNAIAAESNWQGTFLSAPVSSAVWHHAALVLDGTATVQPGALRAYLDGASIGTGDGSQLWDHGDDVGIGRVDGSTRFHAGPSGYNADGFAGFIDDVRVYSRPLSDSEIGYLAATTESAPESTNRLATFAAVTSSDEESAMAANPTLTLAGGTVPVRAIEPNESVTKERRHIAFDVVYRELGAGAARTQNLPGQATRPTAVPERRSHSARNMEEIGVSKLAGSLLGTSGWVNRI